MKGIIISLILSLSILGLTGCSKDIEEKDTLPEVIEEVSEEAEVIIPEPEELLIWSYTDDILTEIQSFEEAYNADVTVEIVEMQGMAPMLNGIIKSGQAVPDLLIVNEETLHLETMSDFWMDLIDLASEKKADQVLIPYVYEGGFNEVGQLVGLSYQGTPMAIYFRRSAAIEALGSDDPQFIAGQFANTQKLLETGQAMDSVGYKLFSDIYSLRYFIPNHDGWSLDEKGALVLNDQVRPFLKMIKTFQFEEYVGYMPEWSNGWLESMHGSVVTEDEEIKVFAYVLPSWALRHVLMLVGESDQALVSQDQAGVNIYNETMGDWALAELIHPTYMGSSYMGIYKDSEHTELAQNFLDYMIFDEEHVATWMDGSDMISSLSSVQADQEFTPGNEFLGGQDYHRMFGNIAQVLHFNPDRIIEDGDEMGMVPYEIRTKVDAYYEEVVMRFIQGDYHTIDEALKDLKENGMIYVPEVLESGADGEEVESRDTGEGSENMENSETQLSDEADNPDNTEDTTDTEDTEDTTDTTDTTEDTTGE